MHLYIHIPFCKQACYYCDFHFSTNLSYKTRMVEAIAQEIRLHKDYLQNKQLRTVYFGGGSPSILSIEELTYLFKILYEVYDLSQVQEITLEANPDDISRDKLNAWSSLGINRLSLGIQTFNDVYLKFMNRAHTGKEALHALEWVLEKGFETSSIDLIYAKTGIHLDEKRQAEILRKDLEIIRGFDLKHISAYNLTIEEETVFGKWAKLNKIVAIPEDYAAEQYGIVTHELGNMGYEQYEISNFARDQKYAVHNTSYWKGEEYLGVGPSAHSYNGVSRQWNIAHNAQYMEAIENGKLPFEREILSLNDQVNDYLLTGLRTIWGADLNKISQISERIPSEFWDTLNEQITHGYIQKNNQQIRINPEYRILADKIASDLFWL